MTGENTPREIGLVGCTKSKRDHPAKPADLYMPSAFFRKASRYAREHHDEWYILSARHHVLDPEGDPIDPYDETLSGAPVARKRRWSRTVFYQLREMGLLVPGTRLVFHTGRDYYDQLIPLLHQTPVEIKTPTDGLSFGETLSWYSNPER